MPFQRSSDAVRDMALFNIAIDSTLRGCVPPIFVFATLCTLESTTRYLGIEVDDALELSEQTGI
jgi:hypothetical protein